MENNQNPKVMKVKITVIKFEMQNGKKVGKSFVFELDPKPMARYKTEATVRKKVQDYVMKSGVFKPDEIRELQYDMGNFLAEWRRQLSVAEAEEQAKFEAAHSQSSRVTPAHISSLKENEVFVFGSNEQVLHYGGAARAAVEHFGAIMGQGSGLQGNS